MVEHLAAESTTGRTWDLSGLIVALPTSWATVRLAELLAQRAKRDRLTYRPPMLVTAGELPERLYTGDVPAAIEFEQTLAWARVLKRQSADQMRPLVPVMPESASLAAWLELAGTLRRLAADLASHQVPFSDVLAVAETQSERDRWMALERLHQLYLQELSVAGRSDLHQQRQAAVRDQRVRTDRRVVLAGTSDLNASITAVLDAMATKMVALIAAPKDQAFLFDRWGCVRPEAFAEFDLPLFDDHLVPAADVGDQAAAAVELLDEFSARHAPGEMVLGVTDPSQIAPAEIELESTGRSPYRYTGWSVRMTAVGRLFDRTATLLTVPTWRSLASIVRHGDVHRYLSVKLEKVPSKRPGEDFLVDLDRLLANHLPVRLGDPLPAKADENYPLAGRLAETVAEWLSPLTGQANWSPEGDRSAPSLPIARWCERISEWLRTLYGGDQASDEASVTAVDETAQAKDWDLTTAAVAKVEAILERFAALSSDLDEPVSVAVALEMIAGRLADLRVVDKQRPEQIPIRGWLDLAMDDAPAMVVIGLNHPFVPSAVTSDPFLPGSVRSQLRLGDNERRHARDVYAMQLMISTRRNVRFIVGKTAADGSPTPPSRLLASASADDIARRVRLLLDGKRDHRPLDSLWTTDRMASDLPIATLSPAECPVTMMSVTAFKAYLDCPYRFYLRYVLKLKPVDDSPRELAANQFGDLVHGALEDFGRSDAKDETDEQKIYAALRDFLHQYAASSFGDAVEPAVTLQIQQAERRLRFVAAEQALRIASGWKIHRTEAAVSIRDAIKVGDRMIGLSGRLDRIDQHEDSGQWAILDYKTHGHKPEKKHLKKIPDTDRYRWVDLQLPLYRLMIPQLGIETPADQVQLGYFNVSDKPEETKINIAKFSEELMTEAQELIEQCARRILNCDFAPSSEPVQYDDYSMILQTGVASRMLAAAAIDESEDTL